ncbi:Pentapeptide repeat family protein [Minicystis rosea]|nr:Pentapeptide repeat family protein [Minicystis rosea]
MKSTFRIVPGGPAEIIDPIEIVREEREGAAGVVEAPDEAVPYLPNAAAILVGFACAIGEQRTPSATVRFGLATDRALIDKALYVYGERTGPAAAPAPFLKMPITYDRAYGGPLVPENPAGTGAERGSRLPNVVVPGNEGRPGGFGPISKTWPARRRLLGGVDPAVLDAEAPEIPAGLDWRYFNPAPADQQIEALRGDEWILLDGMHPTHARVQTRLPGARARAERSAAGTTSAAVDLRADMLLIDADNMVFSLVWRGRFAATGLDDIRVAAGVELPGQPLVFGARPKPPAALAATGALDLRAIGPALPFLAKKTGPVPAQPGAPAEGSPQPAPMAAGLAVAKPADAVEIDKSRERESLPFQATGKTKSATAGVVMPKVVKAPTALSMTGGLDVHLLLKDSLPFARQLAVSAVPEPPTLDVKPAAPAEPPPPPAAAPAPVAPDPVTASAPVAPPPVAAPAEKALAERVVDAEEDEDDEDAAIDVRAAVIERLAARSSLLGLDLVGADLHGLDFEGRLMSGLDLRRANLSGARFCRVRMTGANLAGADLTDAVLSGANLSYATLDRAILTRAQMDGATLADANLSGVDGAEVNFAGADIRRAKLTRAKLTGASFDGADLRKAVLDGAELEEAALEGARLGKKRKASA